MANVCEICGKPARVRVTEAEGKRTVGYCEAHQPNDLAACEAILSKPVAATNRLRDLSSRTDAAIAAPRDQHVEAFVRELERFRQGIGKFARADVASVQSFLMGFTLAAQAAGLTDLVKSWRRAVAARGYNSEHEGLVPQMRRRGMDERAIMDELIGMEIDAFKRLLEHHPE